MNSKPEKFEIESEEFVVYGYAKWYVVGWRLLWILPLYLFRLLFVFFVFCAYGWKEAVRAYESTS